MSQPLRTFSGSLVALATPFGADGQVDYQQLEALVEFQLNHHTDGIVALGTTAETPTLSQEEKDKIAQTVISKVAGRIPVIVGAGSNDTLHAAAMARRYEAMGADGLLVVTPYYNKATQRGLVRHYQTIADAVTKPVILYNVPSRTGVKCAAETYAALSKHPNIVGVKEASGDFSLIQKTRELCPEDFYIWSGNDDETAPIMLLGGVGVISVAANVVPGEMARLTHACLKGDFVTAGRMQLQLRKLCEALFWEVNPIPVKTALAMMGRCREILRQPLCEMEEETKERLQAVMAGYGLVG